MSQKKAEEKKSMPVSQALRTQMSLIIQREKTLTAMVADWAAAMEPMHETLAAFKAEWWKKATAELSLPDDSNVTYNEFTGKVSIEEKP